MIARTMLGILAAIGFTVLANPPRDAKAQMTIEQKLGFASSEKPKTEVTRRRSPKKQANWRHSGGRHPHYGGRY